MEKKIPFLLAKVIFSSSKYKSLAPERTKYLLFQFLTTLPNFCTLNFFYLIIFFNKSTNKERKF